MVAEDPSSVGISTVMILDVLSRILVGVAVGSAFIVDTSPLTVITIPSIVRTVSDVKADVGDDMSSIVTRY